MSGTLSIASMPSVFELSATSVFGALAGLLSGFLGIGGGAILTPLFVFVLGFEQHRAQGISLAALLPPVGLPAVLSYRRAGVRVDARVVTLLVLGFAVGAFGGAWLAHRVDATSLRRWFAAFLVVSAIASLRKSSTEDDASGAPVARAMRAAAPIGMVAGCMSGLLGVGGGIVALPMLRRFGRLTRLEAQATTLAMMLPPIGLPAVFVYAREQGGLPWAMLAALGLWFALGAWGGAHVARRVNANVARHVYGVVLIVVAVVLAIRS